MYSNHNKFKSTCLHSTHMCIWYCVCFQMSYAIIGSICSTLLHCMFSISLTCLSERMPHWLHWFSLFHCAFSSVSSNHLSEKKHCHIGCICLTFIDCAFSNVFSNCLREKRQSHIGHICLTFLHCALSNVSSNHLPQRKRSHTGYICLAFLHCAFLNVSSNR